MVYITHEHFLKWLVEEAQTDKVLEVPDEFRKAIGRYLLNYNKRLQNLDKDSVFYKDELKILRKHHSQAMNILKSINAIREMKRNET